MLKSLFLLILSLILSTKIMSQETAKLIYFGDPMCSWCYGFSPELSAVVDQLGEELELEMVMGGLRPYNTQSMPELKSFLTGHWHEVSERSGQEFSYGILDEKEITYDTEPPSRAFIIIRDLCPGSELLFFKELQILFYLRNKNMHLAETYFEAVEQLGISKEKFTNLFESEEYKNKIKADFEKSASLGVRGFPTLLLKKGEEIYLISNGYKESGAIIESIQAKL